MSEKSFKNIDNIAEYVTEGIKSGVLQAAEAAKFARVTAREGIEGEKVETKMASGLVERVTTVGRDENGELDWVVTNPVGGESWPVKAKDFKKKYEIDPENPEQFKPKGGPVISVKVSEDITFPLWGKEFNLEAGGVLIVLSQEDIYGIQAKEFADTYKSTGRPQQEAQKELEEKLGIERPRTFATIEEAKEKIEKMSPVELEKHSKMGPAAQRANLGLPPM